MPQYQTLALQLIRAYPLVHYSIKEQNLLVDTIMKEAKLLEQRHRILQEQLSLAQPDSDPISIESAALEIALKELQDRLALGLPPADQEALSLEGAMAFLKKATPPA